MAAIALPIWQPMAAQDAVANSNDVSNSDLPQLWNTFNREIGSASESKRPQSPRQNVSLKVIETGSLTVCDGSVNNRYVPVYSPFYNNPNAGGNTGRRTRSQMIYLEEMLTGLQEGDQIQSLTFYAPNGITCNGGVLTFQVGKTTQNACSSNTWASFSGSSVSGTVALQQNATEFTVTFNTPLTYTGGNLLVDATVTTAGTASSESNYTNFVGVTTGGNQSRYYYRDVFLWVIGVDQTDTQQFLPKMNIGYTRDVIPYAATFHGNGDFGNVVIDQKGRATFIVTNTGKYPFTPVVTLSGDQAFTMRTTGYGELEVGDSRYYQVTFAPTATQSYNGTLTLTAEESEATEYINATATLSGIGVETLEEQVADGTAAGYVPVYLANLDLQNHGQIIYQASELNLQEGTLIKKITFHANNILAGQNQSSSNPVTLKIGETTNTTYSSATSYISTDGFAYSTVNNILTGTNSVTFIFDEPYEYKGGNLVVDASCAAGGDKTLNSVTWLGKNSSNASIIQYGSTNTRLSFIPKITIDYIPKEIEGRDITVLKPEDFDGITYRWPINASEENQTESKLSDIATDPDQIIAMIREVYRNPGIPGNLKRGFNINGGGDHDDNVPYTGVGEIVRNGNSVSFDDKFGWNLPSEVSIQHTYNWNGTTINYWYLDQEAYKPTKDGVTLLLLEIVDDFDKSELNIQATSGYAQLREYFSKTIKSARVITQSKRTGTGLESGTLFKIDCDKMNKFYLIAKGQLQWMKPLIDELDFWYEPLYIYANTNNDSYVDPAVAPDYSVYFFLGHMFEQFSPAKGNALSTKDDIYKDLIDMNSFGVIHDCPNVPFVENGHHFMMYGQDSDPDDCQDVRDMMFFVPDYRMMEHIERGTVGVTGRDRGQDYFYYNPVMQPTMAMFVIHQDEIPEGEKITLDEENNKYLYKHQLAWRSNLDDFLPGDEQEYELWEIVVDEFGIQSYQPVYYRNSNGDYTDALGNVIEKQIDDEGNETYIVDDQDIRVPIVLDRVNMSSFDYTNVYVDMEEGSQTKTYVIRGRDKAHFMSLQMSNMQEIIIPGLDPNEKARMIGATYYSRYNPDNEKNCYSNKLELSNNGVTLTEGDLNGKTLNFYRSSRAAQVENGNAVTDADGNIQYVTTVNKELIATGTSTSPVDVDGVPTGTITITLVGETQSPKSDYPNGKTSGEGAAYHDNNNLTFQYTIVNDHVHFSNFAFWDNFTVDVKKNVHPLQYLYKMEVGTEGQEGFAYSNEVRVPVYKTDSKMKVYTKEEVDADVDGELTPDVEFSAKIQLSSKTEILRYDAYRWEQKAENGHYYIVDKVEANGDEQDLPPTGMAMNQGDWYTVSMNRVQDSQYYYDAPDDELPHVSTTNPTNWATFVDYYPKQQPSAKIYVYAPVVELFTRGYKETNDGSNKVRDDYNTYGGPMQFSATGLVDINIPQNEVSSYSWKVGDDRYAYYNVVFTINHDQVPDDSYEIYRVRAWREIDTDLLDEQLEQFAGRVKAKYLFEDMLGTQEEGGEYQAGAHMSFGSTRLPDAVDNSGNSIPVYRGTFGARKVQTTGNNQANDGCVDNLDMTFKVRIYFTPKTTAKAPQLRAGEESKPYYIAEYEYPYTIEGGIPTGIETLGSHQVVDVKYYNVAGIESSTPFQGVNIVVTRYDDGTTKTTKIIK
jgi:hypothetical protein